MNKKVSQNLSGKPTMTIEEEDLFVYWLNKIWPKHHLDFDEFKTVMIKKGVKIVNSNEFIAF